MYMYIKLGLIFKVVMHSSSYDQLKNVHNQHLENFVIIIDSSSAVWQLNKGAICRSQGYGREF